jgi:hypothetical protein
VDDDKTAPETMAAIQFLIEWASPEKSERNDDAAKLPTETKPPTPEALAIRLDKSEKHPIEHSPSLLTGTTPGFCQ